MAMAVSRPIQEFAERLLGFVAGAGRHSPAAWWLAIPTIAPLLGAFINEPAAMTIAASLLARKFYALRPSLRLRHGTLGLLFVNISVGGTLTHFAAPPVLMVAREWQWDLPYMLAHFGWRAVLGIVAATLAYYFIRFGSDTAKLASPWLAEWAVALASRWAEEFGVVRSNAPGLAPEMFTFRRGTRGAWPGGKRRRACARATGGAGLDGRRPSGVHGVHRLAGSLPGALYRRVSGLSGFCAGHVAAPSEDHAA